MLSNNVISGNLSLYAGGVLISPATTTTVSVEGNLILSNTSEFAYPGIVIANGQNEGGGNSNVTGNVIATNRNLSEADKSACIAFVH